MKGPRRTAPFLADEGGHDRRAVRAGGRRWPARDTRDRSGSQEPDDSIARSGVPPDQAPRSPQGGYNG